jgi:hypothetical protein
MWKTRRAVTNSTYTEAEASFFYESEALKILTWV